MKLLNYLFHQIAEKCIVLDIKTWDVQIWKTDIFWQLREDLIGIIFHFYHSYFPVILL